MAITKIQSESLNLADTYAFTGTVTGAGGVNTPAFFASHTGDQTVNDATNTKISYSNEVYDTDSTYDASTNYRWTPGFVGKSFICAGLWSSDAQTSIYEQKLFIYKNGSEIIHAQDAQSSSREWKQNFMTVSGVIAHDADDYYEVYGYINTNDGGSAHYPTGSGNNAIFRNYFYGYKIIE